MPSFLNSDQAKAEAEEAQQAENEHQDHVKRLLKIIDAQQERINALDDTLARAYLTIKSLEIDNTILRMRWSALKDIADGNEPTDSG